MGRARHPCQHPVSWLHPHCYDGCAASGQTGGREAVDGGCASWSIRSTRGFPGADHLLARRWRFIHDGDGSESRRRPLCDSIARSNPFTASRTQPAQDERWPLQKRAEVHGTLLEVPYTVCPLKEFEHLGNAEGNSLRDRAMSFEGACNHLTITRLW